jgi:hypothetical protein
MENRIEGSWRLKSAERTTFVSWKSINSDYQGGTFTFNSDGTALYSDNNLSMRGDWVIRKVRDWYDDDDDDPDLRMALAIHLYDFNSQQVLNLDFDHMRFWGRNRLVAEYQRSGYRYKYVFER